MRLYCINKQPGMKTERSQRVMNTANHKPVSESVRVSDEKTPTCKAFVGMKIKNDNLIYPLYL